jgi:hypothetical protein
MIVCVTGNIEKPTNYEDFLRLRSWVLRKNSPEIFRNYQTVPGISVTTVGKVQDGFHPVNFRRDTLMISEDFNVIHKILWQSQLTSIH